MTIRRLLTHTSGIAYGFSNPIEYRLTEATKGEWELPLLKDPGDKWNYGSSTTVLDMIAEKITGEPLELTSSSISSNRWAWWIHLTPCHSTNRRAWLRSTAGISGCLQNSRGGPSGDADGPVHGRRSSLLDCAGLRQICANVAQGWHLGGPRKS
jgi:hypothetical protein